MTDTGTRRPGNNGKKARERAPREDDIKAVRLIAPALAGGLLSSGLALAGPQGVPGPGADPDCLASRSAGTGYLQWPPREGPCRIAIVNGFVGNGWRIQMIKTAKAFAQAPSIRDRIAEFKVVSTGTDAAVQLGAIEDVINQAYDAIVAIAVAPDGFDRVIRLADRNDVVLVPFDNVRDTDRVMQVNEDQLAMGRTWAGFVLDQLKAEGKTSGRILEMRGLPGDPVDRDRSPGIGQLLDEPGGGGQRVSAVGKWDDGAAQKVLADAIAVHLFRRHPRPGRHHRRGAGDARFRPSDGAGGGRIRKRLSQARRSACRRGPEGHLDRPVAGSGGHRDEGRDFGARGQSGAATDFGAAARGDLRPVAGWRERLEDLPDTFFTVNECPPCGVNITGPAIVAQSEADTN
ncbi:substrate-binding domain-containing protein [Rhodovulum visakhapatnamense]|uniref:Ribose transport system substrate-binding protein n=1 Tax=Rhodovulum visakhapatnamense TaxID=364297 RepID=A0A4R8FT05_9RHOB|nr:substrate-binding domain-containing protein [Rhodovulum visakhapatnamense]TDX29584.1 ribose transport system substrate-binding protein [Rhodovulum visakhapatnamense]